MSHRKHHPYRPRDAAGPAELESSNDPLHDLLAPLRTNFEHYRTDAVQFAQRNPEKALLSALVAGYLLRLVPITRIAASLISVVSLLWKPVALIIGGRKLWELLQAKTAHPKSDGSVPE